MNDNVAKASNTLNLVFSRFDRAFAEGQVANVSDMFAEDARMLWPGTEDIIGRDEISAALTEFFEQFETLSYSHDRRIVEQFGPKVFTVGRFLEDLAPKAGGPAQRVHGRMVELWAQSESGNWEITLLLTGRYAENEMLPENVEDDSAKGIGSGAASP